MSMTYLPTTTGQVQQEMLVSLNGLKEWVRSNGIKISQRELVFILIELGLAEFEKHYGDVISADKTVPLMFDLEPDLRSRHLITDSAGSCWSVVCIELFQDRELEKLWRQTKVKMKRQFIETLIRLGARKLVANWLTARLANVESRFWKKIDSLRPSCPTDVEKSRSRREYWFQWLSIKG